MNNTTQLYHLGLTPDTFWVSKIEFDGAPTKVPLDTVECQVYADALGTESLGSITNKLPIRFNPPRSVAGYICYVAASLGPG